MAKDINIHLKTHGAARTKQQLEDVGQASKKVGDSVEQGGEKGADGINKMSDAAAKGPSRFARLTSSIKSWVFSLVGISALIAGITRAIQAQKQAIEEHGRIAAEQQKKMLALMGMGTFFEEHPQARKKVAAYAEFGRRPFEEVAEAWYALESKGAGLTEKQKAGIMKEALELGRMEPEADLKSIVDVFSLYAKETRQKDINQIQNVIRQTLSQAGAELSQIGQYLPRFLSLGIAGGLTGAETAGLWAFATTRAPTPEAATVGVRNIFAALRGKGTPESQKLLQQLGITSEMNIFEQLSKLSAAQKTGKFGVPEAEMIAGRENIAVLLSMLTEPKAMMETVRSITKVARPDIDIVKSKLDLIMNKDEVARLEEEGRRLDIAIKNIKGRDIRAMRVANLLREIELEMRKEGRSEAAIRFQLFLESMAALLGGKPSESGKEMELDVIWPKIKKLFEAEAESASKTETETSQVKTPARPISKETESEAPVQPVSKETGIEIPVQPTAKETEEELIIQPASKETGIEIPVQPTAKETEVELPVEAIAEQQQVNVPVEVAVQEQVKVPVDVEAVTDKQQVKVPVEAVADMQPVEVPVRRFEEPAPVTVVHNHYYYDYGMRFFPRVGDDESGPRIKPGAIG